MTATAPPPEIRAQVHRLKARFPWATCWYGTRTGGWWAMLPDHPRLIEAATADALAQAVAAKSAVGPRVGLSAGSSRRRPSRPSGDLLAPAPPAPPVPPSPSVPPAPAAYRPVFRRNPFRDPPAAPAPPAPRRSRPRSRVAGVRRPSGGVPGYAAEPGTGR